MQKVAETPEAEIQNAKEHEEEVIFNSKEYWKWENSEEGNNCFKTIIVFATKLNFYGLQIIIK